MQNKQPQQEHNDSSESRFPWLQVVFVTLVLLCVAIGTTLWLYLGHDAAIIFGIIFTSFGVVFAFLQLTPSLLARKSSNSSTTPQITINTQQEHPLTKEKNNSLDTSYVETGNKSVIQDHTQLFTALDIGTAFAKAIIVEVHGDFAEVLGVGRSPQNYNHMSDGIITDIQGVIENCNNALIKAEKAAGGIVAPNVIIGIAGELVKGYSTTVSKHRQNPNSPISGEELESLIANAQRRLQKLARDTIEGETGLQDIEVRLINSAMINIRIDGQLVSNPIGFRGRHFTITLFSAFAPLLQLGALETVAQGLDLTTIALIVEPYALARCLSPIMSFSTSLSYDKGGIFIDIGGGTTDIALVRNGGIEQTRMFALGGRTFTLALAAHKGIAIEEAEELKLSYSSGEMNISDRDEIRHIFAPECRTWIDAVELIIRELANGEIIPPAINFVGGSSALPDLKEKLENFPWIERLPFAQAPIVRVILPNMILHINDPEGYLIDAQDITPMALAFQAVELLELESSKDNVTKTLKKVSKNM